MNKIFRALAIGLISLHATCTNAQTEQADMFLVPVTTKPSPLLRLQFTYENDSVHLYGTNMGALPLALKKTKFTNPKTKLNFKNTAAVAEAAMDRNFNLQNDTSFGFRAKRVGQSYYKVMETSFLSGKGTAPIFVNQTIPLGGFPAAPTWPLNFSAKVKKVGVYSVVYLPAMSLSSLPVFDTWNCVEAPARFYQLRALQGYGLEKITYKTYNARRRETVGKAFDIFFDLNSVQPRAHEIKPITDYLEQNQFEILNAVMEGGSSVEGDEARNKKLQRDRARVIRTALARYNRSAVKKDTILLYDNWKKFREELKKSKFAWLDSLSNDNMLGQINTNEKLRLELEPILKNHRKASLQLTMAKILTVDEQFVLLHKSLNGWLKTLTTAKQPSKELEPQIMGAIAYLFEQHANNDLNKEEVDSLLRGDYEEHKYLYLGLHIIKQFNENKFGPEDKNVWQEKWESLELEPWFSRAQESLVRLAEHASKTNLDKYLRMHADFQAFSYRLINLGVMDINFLCKARYPEREPYLSLLLNQYAFLFEMANVHGKFSNCTETRKSLTGKDPIRRPRNIERVAVTPIKLDSIVLDTAAVDSLSVDPFADNVKLDTITDNMDTLSFAIGTGLKRTGFKQRMYSKPTYSKAPMSAYYFILKQGFLKGNKNILNKIDGNLSLDPFSLHHLLDISVSLWRPEENYFYDKEARLEEMERLVNTLKKGNSICAPVVNDLYLDYHLKALRYLELYFEPGSAKHKEIAAGSLKFITEYYKRRLHALHGDTPLKIALYLNRFSWFPGANEGAWFGYDFLSNLAKHRVLNDTEMKLWANYLKVYDPELKKPLPRGYAREAVVKLMNEPYQ